jgi:hypothetical protein
MKKQELLNFIEEYISDDTKLYCNVEYVETKDVGGRLFYMDKQRLINQIETMFDDDLIGHSGDNILIEVLDWAYETR